VRVRLLRLDDPADEALCAGFECGNEEWELEVSDFLNRKIWLKGREPERTLIAIDEESGRIFGFGAWKHTTVELPQRPDPVEVIRICYFGVDSAFKGAVDDQGRRLASVLYATVEADALSKSADGTPIELFCDARNERGRRFWTGAKRGFQIVGAGYGHLLRLVRRPV
jgi:hypothetical protein